MPADGMTLAVVGQSNAPGVIATVRAEILVPLNRLQWMVTAMPDLADILVLVVHD